MVASLLSPASQSCTRWGQVASVVWVYGVVEDPILPRFVPDDRVMTGTFPPVVLLQNDVRTPHARRVGALYERSRGAARTGHHHGVARRRRATVVARVEEVVVPLAVDDESSFHEPLIGLYHVGVDEVFGLGVRREFPAITGKGLDPDRCASALYATAIPALPARQRIRPR